MNLSIRCVGRPSFHSFPYFAREGRHSAEPASLYTPRRRPRSEHIASPRKNAGLGPTTRRRTQQSPEAPSEKQFRSIIASGCFGLRFLCDLAKAWGRAATKAKQPSNFAHSFFVLGSQFAPCAHQLVDQPIRLFAGLRVGRKHRWNCRERRFLIDQQDVELLANQGFEIRDRHIAVRLANATGHFKTALVDRGSIHARINESTDDGRTGPTGRYAGSQLFNSFLQQFSMQRVLGCFSQTLRFGGVDADCGLKRR